MSILRLLLHGLLGLVMLCSAGQVQAEGLILKGLGLDWNLSNKDSRSVTTASLRFESPDPKISPSQYANPCTATARLIYTTASHPGGHRNGRLNEKNGGYGGRCYTDQDKNFYLVFAQLENSQYGDTFAFGPGIKWRFLEFKGVSIDVGAEVPYVYYAYGRRPGAIQGPLPYPWVGVNWKLMKGVEIGMMQMWLPKGSAQLRATVIEGSYSPLRAVPEPEPLWRSAVGDPFQLRNGDVPRITIIMRFEF